MSVSGISANSGSSNDSTSGTAAGRETKLGQDAFMRGQSVNGYVMNANSAATLDTPSDAAGPGITPTLNGLFAPGAQANALERAYAATLNHSAATATIINTGLQAAPTFSTYFPNASGYDLDTQLHPLELDEEVEAFLDGLRVGQR